MYNNHPTKRQNASGCKTSKLRKNLTQGFTLIEVLLAMAITVIVSVIAYQALDSVMGIVDSQKQQEEKIKNMGLFFSIFNKDFRQIVPRKIKNPIGQGYKHALFYNAEAVPMLEFTRGGWGNPAPTKFQRSHLQRVAYQLEDKKLIRKSWRALDRYEDAKPDEAVLLTGVTSFKMRFLTNRQQTAQSGQNGNQKPKPWTWVEQWPANQSSQSNNTGNGASETLPMAIEIEIDVEKWGKLRRVFEIAGGL